MSIPQIVAFPLGGVFRILGWYPVAEKYYVKKKRTLGGYLRLLELRGDFFEGALEYFQTCIDGFACYD